MYEPKMDGQEYVTITLTRAEYDALVRAMGRYRGADTGDLDSLAHFDLKMAAQKIEAAGQRRPGSTTEAAGVALPMGA